MNLYKVTLCGMEDYRVSYVVSEDSEKAYKTVREYLDNMGIGPSDKKALKSVELIAEDAEYPECKTRLFVNKN